MKGLKVIGIITGVLALILVGSLFWHSSKTDAAYENGYREGYCANKYEEGYSTGYKQGFKETVGTGYIVRNPTYSEAKEILNDDKTRSASQINNTAEAKGIRAAYVSVEIAHGVRNYGIVAFETVDKGLVFFDSSSDKELDLEIGKYCRETGWCGTITKITVIW